MVALGSLRNRNHDRTRRLADRAQDRRGRVPGARHQRHRPRQDPAGGEVHQEPAGREPAAAREHLHPDGDGRVFRERRLRGHRQRPGSGHVSAARSGHDPHRALVHGADGPGDLRCLRRRRQAGGGLRPPCAAQGPRPLRGPGLEAGGGAGARILPGAGQYRSRSAAPAAGRALRADGDGAAVLWHRRHQRVRSHLRGCLRFLRGAGDRHRYADP